MQTRSFNKWLKSYGIKFVSKWRTKSTACTRNRGIKLKLNIQASVTTKHFDDIKIVAIRLKLYIDKQFIKTACI